MPAGRRWSRTTGRWRRAGARRRRAARAGRRQLGRDPLAGQQRRDAGRVAGDRLGRDAAGRLVDGDHVGLAEERLARRHDDLVLEPARAAHERGLLARALDPADGLREVVREALERAGRLVEAEDQHHRRVRGQLDVDVVVRRAARPRPRSPCSRCRGRRSRSAAGPSPPRRGARRTPRRSRRRPRRRRSPRARGARPRSCRVSSASPWSASWRRAPSSEAISSADCEVERTSRTRARDRVGVDPAGRAATCSIADCVSEPTILCVEVIIASAPSVSADGGSVGVEAEVRAPRLVDDERDAGRVADRRAALDVGAHAVVGRRDDERGPRLRRALQRGGERLGRDAVRHPELLLVLRRDERRRARRRARGRRSPTRASCAARRPTAPSGASARQSAWLPCVAPLVRKNVRAAPCASAASSSARW